MTMLAAMVLLIRVFDRSGDLPAERTAAMKTAATILQQAGIETTWVDCSSGSPAATAAACMNPLAPGELAVRITPAPIAHRTPGPTPLGYSLVEPGGGSLATVFTDRVAALAELSRTRPATILGRALAHEIGHLLIGTTEHARTGLMRATWTVHEVARNRREDWLFSPADAERLRTARPSSSEPTRVAETIDTPPPAS